MSSFKEYKINKTPTLKCCRGCNARKGQKPLSAWLQIDCYKELGITPVSVAPIIKLAIANGQ